MNNKINNMWRKGYKEPWKPILMFCQYHGTILEKSNMLEKSNSPNQYHRNTFHRNCNFVKLHKDFYENELINAVDNCIDQKPLNLT